MLRYSPGPIRIRNPRKPRAERGEPRFITAETYCSSNYGWTAVVPFSTDESVPESSVRQLCELVRIGRLCFFVLVFTVCASSGRLNPIIIFPNQNTEAFSLPFASLHETRKRSRDRWKKVVFVFSLTRLRLYNSLYPHR